MAEDSLSGLSKLIPTLHGTESFTKWRRAIHAYLLDKGAVRVLEGRELEPFRRVAENPAELAILRPAGEYAGAEEPNAEQTRTGNLMTVAQRNIWNEWEKKERKARATILLTVSAGIAAEIENLWSAHDMYEHIKSEHKIDTIEHRGNILWRIQSLRLDKGCNADQMNHHYETFTTLISEAQAAGITFADWDKCQKFLLTLPDDLELLRLQYKLLPEANQSWRYLVTTYKSLADSRRMKQEQDATVNAIFAKAGKQPKKKGQEEKKVTQPQAKQEDGQKKKQAGKKDKTRCGWCNIPGHKEGDCRKKAAGEPSHAMVQQAAKQLMDKKGSVNHVDADEWTSSGDIFGSIHHVSNSPHSTSSYEFLLDSGASHHLVNDRSILSSVRTIKPITFGLAGSGSLKATEKGSITFEGATFANDVHYVPDVRLNILSLTKLHREGWKVDFSNHLAKFGRFSFKVSKDGLPKIQLQRATHGLTHGLPSSPLGDVYAVPQVDSKLQQEHRRLGHLGKESLLNLAKGGHLKYTAEELKGEEFNLSDCHFCLSGASKRQPKTGESPRGSAEGEMLHVDLTGRLKTSAEGHEYALIMVADYTNVKAAIPIKLKSEAMAAVQAFVARLEKQADVKVKTIRSDLGSEFNMTAFCERTGINHQTTPGYASYLNGVAERAIGIIKDKSAIMSMSSSLGPAYWNYAMRYAVTILNKISPSGIEGKTAWEVITGRKANLEAVREYGEVCFAHVPPETRPKADITVPKARQARILGMDENVTGWIVRYEDNGSVGLSRDVRTATGIPVDAPLASVPPAAPRTAPKRVEQVAAPPPQASIPPPQPPLVDLPPAVNDSASPNSVTTPPEEAPLRPVAQEEQNAPLPTVSAPLERQIEPEVEVRAVKPARNVPTATRRSNRLADGNVASTYGAQRTYAAHLAAESALVLAITPTADEPKTIGEAMKRPDALEWLKSVKSELDSLVSKGTWVETTLPEGRKAIGCKWVLKTKTDADGNVIKHKARLVAQGFSQQPGLDFEETFAPVSRMTSLRILLTIAATHDLEVHQADVEGAYLNGELDREIYMRLPHGYMPSKASTTTLLLKKTLYGLKQSGREWWKVLGEVLASIGFVRCENEWGMYVLRDKKGQVKMILIAYVDDIALAAQSTSEVDHVLSILESKWKISRLGEISHILGMKVTRDRHKHLALLSQAAYIDSLMQRFPGYSSNIAKGAPLPVRKLEDEDFETPAVISPYQELVGCLLWLSGCTRPDVSFAASYLSRYVSAPTEAHWQLALRVVSYLVHTRDYGLTLGGSKPKPLEMYVDSDWGGCDGTRRSTTGYIGYLYGSPISWSSKRQTTVAASSMEAEYVAGAEATKDVIWLRSLLRELGLNMDDATVLHVDNQSAIRLAHNPNSHAKSKHIDIKHHLIREQVEFRHIEIEYIETAKQRADGLTKPLSGPAHAICLKAMRVGRL